MSIKIGDVYVSYYKKSIFKIEIISIIFPSSDNQDIEILYKAKINPFTSPDGDYIISTEKDLVSYLNDPFYETYKRFKIEL